MRAGVLVVLVFLSREGHCSDIVLVALEQVGGGCRHTMRSPQHSKGERKPETGVRPILPLVLSLVLALRPYLSMVAMAQCAQVPGRAIANSISSGSSKRAGMVPETHCPHKDAMDKSGAQDAATHTEIAQSRGERPLTCRLRVSLTQQAVPRCSREVDMSSRGPVASDNSVLTCDQSTQHRTARCDDCRAHRASQPQWLFRTIGCCSQVVQPQLACSWSVGAHVRLYLARTSHCDVYLDFQWLLIFANLINLTPRISRFCCGL
ncbi:uncharacterized protein CC84DRAFT_98167 [Paraphaeosphaeria sporulosa]|uniref:Secreted protein n=1 Tax=Paraphaeosphaeria sporulosa TaxID=1460663 RepID=A0A177CZK5_9PLEO|nr:uncharacterized protein CC84DRAFT_98167 [Paraphaeosphaeria sporulosa]OAG12280.1 hypothetical protein CC84DRAFT_98167 [Paraphaeosphaeria sporulosa]